MQGPTGEMGQTGSDGKDGAKVRGPKYLHAYYKDNIA